MDAKDEILTTNKVIVELLAEYQWIYNFQVTKFFIEEPWKHIPEEWKDVLTRLTTDELNLLPFGYSKENWPKSLKEFISTASEMPLPRIISEEIQPCSLDPQIKRGMNPKKQHEVSHMSALINDISVRTGCDVVIDVGSGLGYLGHVLTTVYGLKVIGLESKHSHTTGADKRLFSDTCGKILNVTFEMEDTPENRLEFKSLMRSCFQKFRETEAGDNTDCDRPRISHSYPSLANHCAIDTLTKKQKSNESLQCGACVTESNQLRIQMDMNLGSNTRGDGTNTTLTGSDVPKDDVYRCLLIGLHCCGDLTPAMLKVYSDTDFVRGLCCVSCCYHRMVSQENRYLHFPMSKELGTVMSDRRLKPSAPFLRLGAQETRARWKTKSEESHKSHVKAVAYRSLLELYAHQENVEFSKMFRRIATASDFEDFEGYIEKTLSRCQFSSSEGKLSMRTKLSSLHAEYEDFFQYIEVITVLQVILQPLIERLIIQDRMFWLIENGHGSDMIPVFDDFISPRNIALCSNKLS